MSEESAFDKVLASLKDFYNSNDDRQSYNGIKTTFGKLIIRAQAWRLEELKNGPAKGPWLCAECGKKMRTCSEKDLEKVATTDDINAVAEDFQRAIPVDLKAKPKEKKP